MKVTGARLPEILNLRWDQVDFERALLLLSDSKIGGKPIFLSAHAPLTREPTHRYWNLANELRARAPGQWAMVPDAQLLVPIFGY